MKSRFTFHILFFLLLTAGLVQASIVVNPVSNQAPTVNAGLDQMITLPANATVSGAVSDDGLPDPPGAFTTAWGKVSGPGTVTFGDASAPSTSASFSASGTYVLRLTADDGAESFCDAQD